MKQGLPHFTASTSPHPTAVFLNASVSFCHFFAYGTFIDLSHRSHCSGADSDGGIESLRAHFGAHACDLRVSARCRPEAADGPNGMSFSLADGPS